MAVKANQFPPIVETKFEHTFLSDGFSWLKHRRLFFRVTRTPQTFVKMLRGKDNCMHCKAHLEESHPASVIYQLIFLQIKHFDILPA